MCYILKTIPCNHLNSITSLFAYNSSVISLAVFAVIRQFAILLLFSAVHADHSIRILPAMIFLLIMAFITAVVLIAAWWYHPVGSAYILHIRKMVAFMRRFYFLLSQSSQALYIREAALQVSYEFHLEFLVRHVR